MKRVYFAFLFLITGCTSFEEKIVTINADKRIYEVTTTKKETGLYELISQKKTCPEKDGVFYYDIIKTDSGTWPHNETFKLPGDLFYNIYTIQCKDQGTNK